MNSAFMQLLTYAKYIDEFNDRTIPPHHKIGVEDIDAETLRKSAARISKLECALNNIGRQMLTSELDEDDTRAGFGKRLRYSHRDSAGGFNP